MLAGVAARDERAFSAFYRRHLAMIVGWCVRRTGDPELAADLTAEVFAAALVSAARYEPTHESAAGWLLGSHATCWATACGTGRSTLGRESVSARRL